MVKLKRPRENQRYFGPSVGIPNSDPGVCTRISSTPIDRDLSPVLGAPGMGASRSLMLVRCFAVFGELEVFILRSNDAADSSSVVHDGEDCEDGGKALVDKLAMGSSSRKVGGTCGLAMGPITPDAGGVGSWMELTDGVCDSEIPSSAIDLGSQDEMDGRRVLGPGAGAGAVGGDEGKRGSMDRSEVMRFAGLSMAVSNEEWES